MILDESDKSLIERKFSVFLYLLRRDSENWFKLVHFILTLFFSSLYKRCNTDIIVKTDQADCKSAK